MAAMDNKARGRALLALGVANCGQSVMDERAEDGACLLSTGDAGRLRKMGRRGYLSPCFRVPIVCRPTAERAAIRAAAIASLGCTDAQPYYDTLTAEGQNARELLGKAWPRPARATPGRDAAGWLTVIEVTTAQEPPKSWNMYWRNVEERAGETKAARYVGR